MLLKPAVCYDSLEKWRHATCLSDSGCWRWSWDWHKEAKHVYQKARQAGLMYENKCLLETNKPNFLQKENTLKQLQARVFFFFPSLLYFLSVSVIITWLCFIIPLYHTYSFPSPFPLSLSLPISLCSFFKCLSPSALSPSLFLCVFLPPPQEQNLW